MRLSYILHPYYANLMTFIVCKFPFEVFDFCWDEQCVLSVHPYTLSLSLGILFNQVWEGETNDEFKCVHKMYIKKV